VKSRPDPPSFRTQVFTSSVLLGSRIRVAPTAWVIGVLLLVLAASTFFADRAVSQTAKPQPVTKVRVYVLDGGTIVGRNMDRYNLPTEVRNMSVAVFLIVHPKGVLLFDAGLGDQFVNKQQLPPDPAYTVTTTLKSQLDQIGYSPRDITYLALSHAHPDHIGNANNYAGSTVLIQKKEWDTMFPPSQANARYYSYYSALKDSKTVLLDGDYDVFGDGSVIMVSTPGHSPGHQSLFVKLAETGPVIMTGDAYHYPEERTFHKLPKGDPNIEQSALSRAKMDSIMEWTGAQLWISHDILNYAKLKKAPDFYE
jgi:N-acyl homoserine lactone hydrolase